MAEKIEVVSLIGGELVSSTEESGAREVVLALPLSRLLVRLVRVPAEQAADLSAFLTPLLQELSPYPDEELTVGWEVVSESERGKVVLAAALPESSADDIAEILDTKKLRVTRLDALVFGELRALWPAISATEGGLGTARRLVLIGEGAPEGRRTTEEGAPEAGAQQDPVLRVPSRAADADSPVLRVPSRAADADSPVLRVPSRAALQMIVLDGDLPSAIRSIPTGADLRREAMLCLLEAENFGGAKPLAEIVTVDAVSHRVPSDNTTDTTAPVDAVSHRVPSDNTTDTTAPVDAVSHRVPSDNNLDILASFAPIRSIAPVSVLDSLNAIAARSADADALDARPASWREYLEETRFKAKLTKGVAAAVGVWLLAMGVLFGVPMTYGYMTDYQKGLSKEHQKQYKNVCDMKAKVELVRKYSDHARGALEMTKAVSDRLPEGVELDSFDFKREDGLVFSGLADDPKRVYELKDALTAMADGDENRVFGTVRLGRLTSAKGDKQKFTLECRYEAEEEEE